jgi:glycosyltransferase involved in cell wall biosynthesis
MSSFHDCRVDVSVIICTKNRADSLARTLADVGACELPSTLTAEILVVDNGSSDRTAEVVAEASCGAIPVRMTAEPVAGLSRARNRGMAEARGSVFLWTDDDVRVPKGWIDTMSRPILGGSCDAVAGAVRIPEHLLSAVRGTPLERRLGWLASTDHIDFEDPRSMVGANMAFSRAVLERVPLFDVNLGAGALGFHEETLFASQLLWSGYRIAGCDSLTATVDHHFDVSRVDDDFVMRMAVAMGRSSAYFDRCLARHTPASKYRRLRARFNYYAGELQRRVRGASRLEHLEARLNFLSWMAYLEQGEALDASGTDFSMSGAPIMKS